MKKNNFISSLSPARELTYTEGYRSGHNGAVLKTVRAKVHAGSNPAPSAKERQSGQRPGCLSLMEVRIQIMFAGHTGDTP